MASLLCLVSEVFAQVQRGCVGRGAQGRRCSEPSQHCSRIQVTGGMECTVCLPRGESWKSAWSNWFWVLPCFWKNKFLIYILSGPFSLAVGLGNVPLQVEHGTVWISNLSLTSCYQPFQKQNGTNERCSWSNRQTFIGGHKMRDMKLLNSLSRWPANGNLLIMQRWGVFPVLRRWKAVEMKFDRVSTKVLYFLLLTKIYAVKL